MYHPPICKHVLPFFTWLIDRIFPPLVPEMGTWNWFEKPKANCSFIHFSFFLFLIFFKIFYVGHSLTFPRSFKNNSTHVSLLKKQFRSYFHKYFPLLFMNDLPTSSWGINRTGSMLSHDFNRKFLINDTSNETLIIYSYRIFAFLVLEDQKIPCFFRIFWLFS